MFFVNDLKIAGNYFLRLSLVILFYCHSGVFHLYAQQKYSKFDHLTINDGLSSNRIWCIHRDNKDYLWISTDVGLDKYDSYQFKKYRHDEKQPGTISNDNTLCIYEDREKNLWFGTYDGLNLYDPDKDNFKIFKNSPSDNNTISSNHVNSILEDTKGTLWIITDGDCLNKWVPKTQSFIRYQYDKKQYDQYPRPARMIASDSKGNLWVVSLRGGIFRFEPESGKFTKFDDASIDFGDNCHKSLYIDRHDKIWITSDGSGFFSYDPGINKFEHFGSKGDGKGTNQQILLDIMPEDENHLLIAVDQGGINRFNIISKTFEYFMYDEANEAGLNFNGIWCFDKDREGILWVGTSGGGINYLNPKKDKFKLFKHNGNNPNSLSFGIAGCFFEDHLGLIWIGTDGGGVDIFNPETGKFKIYKNRPSDQFSISGNVIRSITEDKDHDMWIGTWDAGLNCFDRKSGKFFHYFPDKNDSSSISGRTIWNLTIDKDNLLWLANYAVGTDLFDTKKGVIKRFRVNPDDPKSISSNQSYLFVEDSLKNMWICTQNGLNLYDMKNNSFKVYNFPEREIRSFCRDVNGNLWVGTNSKGIFYTSPDGTIIKNFNVASGLPSNIIQAIVEDEKRNIWISTTNGLSRYDSKTQKFRNYSEDDGLQGNQFFQQSFLKSRKGELYFGGYNGFNSFFPDSLKDNDFIPPIYITDFQIFNKPVVYGEPRSQFPTQISEAKEIKLNWHQSVFSFTFSAINYTNPEKNQYAYIMEGFEKEWNFTGASRRYVTYTNLNPGEYTFRVKATNNDGLWNDKGISLHIIILPPWWDTWWFRLPIFFTLIFIIVYIFRTHVRRLNNQKTLLEKMVALKTNELSELSTSKDKFFSIIAHDLKNPFNTIIGFSEILKEGIRSGDNAAIKESTELINTSAIQTLRLLENLLEWANSQTGKIVFNPVPFKLNELFNEELNLLNDMAARKNIELLSSLPEDLIIKADKNMIKTILRNLISNAIKFTQRNGKVEVKAISDNKQVEISVSDTGIGIDKETISKLFRIDANISKPGTDNEKGTGLGLFLCKEFIEKHGGRIWVESEEGRGSTFRFCLPLNINTSV